jgi:hypothetical protein
MLELLDLKVIIQTKTLRDCESFFRDGHGNGGAFKNKKENAEVAVSDEMMYNQLSLDFSISNDFNISDDLNISEDKILSHFD